MRPFRPSKDFRSNSRERIFSVFSSVGTVAPTFDDSPGERYLIGQFELRQVPHTIEIYDDTIVMHAGKHLFECYMPEEYRTEESYISGFASRLGRYLRGEEWAGPTERTIGGLIRHSLSRLMRTNSDRH